VNSKDGKKLKKTELYNCTQHG